MDLPWESLGLSCFVAEADETPVLFSHGEPTEDVPNAEWSRYPWVRFGELTETHADRIGTGIDLAALIRALRPTASDHHLEALCELAGISVANLGASRALGQLLAWAISESLSVDRAVLGLLAQLLPGDLGELLAKVLIEPVAEAPCQEFEAERFDRPPVPEDVSIDGVLGPNGIVAHALPTYEVRRGQLEMAHRVGETLARGGALTVEAGPGTGKTFAYLVPALRHLVERPGSRVVVCTKTKHLQEQLFNDDLPFLVRRIAPGIDVALLKGRENYICLRRWELLVQELSGTLDRVKLAALAPLVRWIDETHTGDVEENAAFLSMPEGRELWPRLGDSPHHCVGAFCPHVEDCFSLRARRRARKAQLVVVNHSLLLADAATRGVILGKYGYLVIDEAHGFESAARSAFTSSLSRRGVERVAEELSPTRGRRSAWAARIPLPPETPMLQSAADAGTAMRTQAAQLLLRLEGLLPADRRGRLPYPMGAAAEIEALRGSVRRCESAVEEILSGLDDEPELVKEGEGWLASVHELGCVTEAVGGPEAENTVHWYEREAGGLVLHVTPLEVAPLLSAMLYPGLEAVILTSATLSLAEGSFDYLERVLGVRESFGRVDGAVVESPFSYADRMRILIPEGFPSVQGDVEAYADAVANLLVGLHRTLRRNGLVLFTSYELLQSVRKRIWSAAPTLAQGIDGPRTKLVERFRRTRDGSLLLGTDSFWEGVDLPGEELEYLIVTRLPFTVPTDPVYVALSERYATRGEDPFVALAIPQAVLRLRQGVGRLIRTEQDRGVVVLTDDRILTKGYGRRFAEALPVRPRRVDSVEAVIREAELWLTS
jgi:ATP-dependent DNA helicase DinG